MNTRMHTHGRIRPRTVVIVIIVLLLAGVAVAAWYTFDQYQRNQAQPPANDTNVTKEEQTLLDAVGEADSDEEKAEAYRELSNHYANEDNTKLEAQDYAQKAVEANPSVESYGQLGFAAAQAGDKQAAIRAYEQGAAKAKAEGQKDDGRSDYSYFLMQARLLKEGNL